MKWFDQGLVLHHRLLGENRTIVSILTKDHGHVKGVFRFSKRSRHLMEIGTLVDATWFARLEDQLGTWSLEERYIPTAKLISNPLALKLILSMAGLCSVCLPEREPCCPVYQAAENFILSIDASSSVMRAAYLRFEFALLGHAGITLDLSHCASTGQTEDLVYVSPRTGRAVSRHAGRPYHDKLIHLPRFLADNPKFRYTKNPIDLSLKELSAAFELTGYFLQKMVFDIHHVKMPQSRHDLIKYIKSNLSTHAHQQ